MMVQMMELQGLFREEQFSTCMARDVRVSGMDDLMGLQARVVVES
jgi:hypothetical protein